jgi:EmrB/QacA subfamily drug resistance transporter
MTETEKMKREGSVPEDSKSGVNPMRILLVLTGVALLVNYVETMVIPGVPTIQHYFNTTATIASWITSAYLIVGSAVSPLFGKMGDIYGKKKMFLISLIFYMAGVALAGFAPSIYVLLFARALQGIGFAIIPLGIAIITDVFPPERVAIAQGIMSGTFAIGAAAGLIVGSYVVQDLGWQYAFHTALILSLVLFVVAARILQKDIAKAVTKAVDYAGAAILIGGITLILLYVTEGPTLGWLSLEELAMLVPGAVLTFAFFLFENRRANPLMRLSLFRIRNVLVANLVGLISGMIMFLLFFAIVYYAQLPKPFGLNLDIINAGLTLAPSTVGMLIGGLVIGRILPRIGPRPILLLGSVILGAGQVLFLTSRATSTNVSIDLFVALFGVICVLVPLVNMLAIALPRDNVAVGLGINTMLRNLGGAIGPVVATTIMATYTTTVVTKINGFSVPLTLPSSSSFNYIFYLGIALAVLVACISLATKNYTFKKQSTPAAVAH